MENTFNIGLVGLGGIAHLGHLAAFQKLDGFRLAVGCDKNENTFVKSSESAEIGSFYTDYYEMLAKEALDAVVIGTPNFLHTEFSAAALERGIDVLCEKPIARTKSEAEELHRVLQKSDARLMIGQCFRYRPEVLKARELLAAGKLGEVYYAKANYVRQRGIPGFGTWFTNKKLSGGGVVLDMGVHAIDCLWFLMGKPDITSVSAMTHSGIGTRRLNGEQAGFTKSRYPFHYAEPEDAVFDVDEVAVIFIRFANGVTVNIDVSWAMNVPEEIARIELYGDRGGVSAGRSVELCYDADVEMKTETVPVERISSHEYQAELFLQFLRGQIDNPASLEDGLVVMRALDAVYESAATGREIVLV